MAERVLDGHCVTENEALAILQCPDQELLALLNAAFRVRRQHFGQTVQLYFLMKIMKYLLILLAIMSGTKH